MNAIAKSFVVAALIATNMSVVFASPTRGPAIGIRRVEARTSTFFIDTFRGNEVATVVIVGDGATDLDIYIWDMNNNLVARAIGATDRETASFLPFNTGEFRIEIRNLGSTWNEFAIGIK